MYKIGKILGIVGVIVNLVLNSLGTFLFMEFYGLKIDLILTFSNIIISLILLMQLLFLKINNIKLI